MDSKPDYLQRLRPGLLLALLFWPLCTLAAPQVLVEAGSANKYLANSSDPGLGITWTAEGFTDSGWTSGLYGIGYENGGSGGAGNLFQTTVPIGTHSVYTRTTFTIADITQVSVMSLGVDYDDGYVAWINGVEVFRSSQMQASGNPEWNTDPVSHESSNGTTPNYSPMQDISSIAIPALHDGSNTLAIAAYNTSGSSSDLVLVPQLSINDNVTRGPYLQQGTDRKSVV